jgi:hypothetical protein
MDTSTRAGRIAEARRLSAALHRTPGDSPATGDTLGPPHCGLSEDEPCDMKNPERCAIHADPPPGDPETLRYSGTASMRRQALREARRQGLR